MDLSQLSDEELLRAAGPISVRNNNPGNLRPVGANAGFRGFETPQAGIQAMRDDLTAKVTGKSRAMNGAQPTLTNLLNVYAPPSENDTAGYINTVAQATGLNPNQPLMPQDVDKLIPAMIKQEGGDMASQYYSKFTPTAETSAQIDYSSMSDEELMKAAGMEAPPVIPAIPEQSGGLSALNNRFNESDQRTTDARQKIAEQYKQGLISKPEAALRMSLKNAQKPFSIAGDIAAWVSPQFLNEGLTDAAGAIADTRAGRYVANQVNDFTQQHPVAAGRIGSGFDAINLALPFKKIGGENLITASTKAADAVIDKTGQVAGKAITRGAERLATPRQIAPNSEQLAEMGVKAYDAARASGEVFDAGSVSNKFVSALDAAKPKKIADVVETELAESLESGLGKYRNIANKPLSIDEVDILDKELTNLKEQAYGQSKSQLAGKLADIQNTLRGSVADAPSGKALAEGRDFFRRKYQMEDVERIFRNAEGRPNEAAIIQTGFRNLANQARKKGSGYTKEQIREMDKAAKGGLSIDALKLASSKLIPIVAGASGGPVGAGVAYMGNLAAGAGATALQTAKANRLARSITKGITVEGEPTLVNRAAQRFTKKEDLQQAFDTKKAEAAPASGTPPKPDKRVVIDNPGGAWLEKQQRYAAEDYAKGMKMNGAVTAVVRDVTLPVDDIASIPGLRGEVRAPGERQYEDLSKAVDKEGFKSDSPILIGINYKGEPFIIEGNTRIAVAKAKGIKSIPAEVKYFAGGETQEGLLPLAKTKKLAGILDIPSATKADLQKAFDAKKGTK